MWLYCLEAGPPPRLLADSPLWPPKALPPQARLGASRLPTQAVMADLGPGIEMVAAEVLVSPRP
eukprot:SAG11_NODE_21183_length_430_cov_0.776435_1_plen_63_part_01